MIRSFLPTIGATIALLSTPTLGNAQRAATIMPGPTLEDLFSVSGLGDVQVSPQGNAVLYTVSTADLDENETDTDIWLIRRDGATWDEPVRLTYHERNDGSPQWHPNGGSFSFLSSQRGEERDRGPDRPGDGPRQRPTQKLYLMDLRGGEPQELFSHPTSITSYAWSPDGAFIAFRAADEETTEEKERQENGRDIGIEDDEGRFTHLWVIDVDAGEARRVTSGTEYTVGQFDWSPDGTILAFSATPTGRPFDSWKSDIYTVAAHDSTATPARLTTNPGPDANPQFTPDGRFLVFSGLETDRYEVGISRVFRTPVEGGAREDISPRADVQPGRYTLTADGRGAFFESTVGTTRTMFYMDLDDRNPVRLTPTEGVYAGGSFSDDARTLVYTYQSPDHAVELFAATLDDDPSAGDVEAQVPLTTHNAHADRWAVGRTEVLTWEGADGREIEGVVVYPMNWAEGDGPRATVVKIHGGPSGVYVQNFQAASTSADAQRYAADGYAVLLPNPRGSSGYGDAGLKSVVGDWGGLDFQDIMAGVDEMVARGIAHPDSLGVMGWSYGGYMTAWTVGQTSRFKAAVAGAAITENISMWGTQDIQHVFEAYFGGGPYEPGMWEVYQRSNPLAFVERATTPTMIIHGDNDPRVPPNQARIFYRALKANGVETTLVWLPRTGHGPREPGLRYETARHQKEWMDRWIRNRPAPPVS